MDARALTALTFTALAVAGSANAQFTERFTPVDENTLSWEVRFEDPATWTAPWAFEMPLKRSAARATDREREAKQ